MSINVSKSFLTIFGFIKYKRNAKEGKESRISLVRLQVI